ncbi:MAG: tetratricopeptide repeat protein [Thainema sp.]
MTEPEETPKPDFSSFNTDARDQSRVNNFGEFNANTVNFGDRIESQRSVLITEIDPIPPRRVAETWIDRTQPQADLIERIQSGRVLLTEVVADGGFGKSLLAGWVYETAQSQFDQALWVNFQKQPSFNAFGLWVLQEIGFLIQDESIPDEYLITQTIYRLSERRCLLVMDQLEEIEQSADRPSFEAFLEQWQQRGRKSTILVTTRNRFVGQDSVRYVLPGFTPQEGAAFLQKQKISASEEVNLEQLSTLAEGHPLLLNLAASWLKETAVGRLNETGLSFFERLFQNNLGDPEAKVEEIFQLLLRQLPERLQTALLEVSVYQNPFDVERAQAMQAEMTEADLELLETRGFLLKREEYWTLHPLMRQFAEETLRERQLEFEAHRKAVEFFTSCLPLELAKLEQDDIENLLDGYLAAFHHYCELSNYKAAYAVISDCYSWLDLWGYYHILVSIYERLTTAWRNHLPTTEEEQKKFSAVLCNLGIAYRSLSQYEKAIELYQQSLKITQEIGDRHGEANNLGNLGSAYYSKGQYEKAIELYQQSLTIKQEIGDRECEAVALGNLGSAYRSLGQYEKAIELYQQSLKIQQELGYFRYAAATLSNLGLAYDLKCLYEKAIELYQQSLIINQAVGDRHGEAATLCNLGNIYNSLSQYEKAIELYQQSLTINQAIGDRRGEAYNFGNLANAYYFLGQYEKAIELYQQSLTINQAIGDRHGEANQLGNLGSVYRSLNQYGKAIELYEQSLKIDQVIGDRNGEAINFFNQAFAYTKVGEPLTAKQSYEAAKAIFEELELDYRVKQCEQAIYDLNQTLVMQLPVAPSIGDEEANQAEEDWLQKSMPTVQPSTSSSSQSQAQWLPYVAIAVTVFILIILVQR